MSLSLLNPSDFGSEIDSNQRMMTILIYLNGQANPNAGGETEFQKSLPHPIRVHPGQGNAILFYSLLNNGNADDLSLHGALPVKYGEKWLANLWIF